MARYRRIDLDPILVPPNSFQYYPPGQVYLPDTGRFMALLLFRDLHPVSVTFDGRCDFAEELTPKQEDDLVFFWSFFWV